MKRLVPIIGLGLGAMASAAIATAAVAALTRVWCSMRTIAGIFVSAPVDGQISTLSQVVSGSVGSQGAATKI
jgi:hypothetical protein